MAVTPHRWKFFRAGDVDQVVLRSGADLANLDQLDPKLWVALAMPTRGVHIDAKTLTALDTDKDGRIRLPDVVAAVSWALDCLTNRDDLVRSSDRLALEGIADADLKASARQILVNLGKPEATEISLEDLSDTARIFADTRFNGDGVVPVESAETDEERQIVADILATQGAAADRSGKDGVNQEKSDAFFAAVDALVTWDAKADATVLALGDQSEAAASALKAVRNKIDDFFTRCRIAAMDPRATLALAGSDECLALLGTRDLSSATEVGELPLALIEPNRALPLQGAINPAWSEALSRFSAATVAPVLGSVPEALTYLDWLRVKTALATYEAWQSDKPAAVVLEGSVSVESLGMERLRALAKEDARQIVADLIEQDLAVASESSRVDSVEKLLLFKRDIMLVLNNFVNFSDFYSRRQAVFQAGILYLDGRGCQLTLEVSDAARHGTLAGLSGAYLAYCDCTRPDGAKLSIVAAFTDGDSDNLLVGRNGLFYDRKGQDWDATITKIVANPISLREAFWSPYKKLARLVEGQFAKRAEKADAAAHASLGKVAEAVGTADQTKPDAKLMPSKVDIGTVAALGVAVGGIGAMVTGVVSTFLGLGIWMPFGMLGALLLVSGPSMLLAFLKLRQRNLGPLLDANGWAINGRARINVPFGAALTDVAKLPPGAERAVRDPYAEKHTPWRTYLVLLVLLAAVMGWFSGRLDGMLPPALRVQRWFGAPMTEVKLTP